MLRGLEGQRVLANEVLFNRLIGGRGQEAGLGQQLDLQRQQIAEDAGHGDDHVDPRPVELIERQQFRAGQAAVTVEARSGAEQRQRLPDRRAFVLEIVGAPQHDRDQLRESVSFGDMLVDQPLRLLRAVLHRKGAGNPERIEAVEIAARRQDRRRPQQIAARRRTNELAVERMQDAGDLVILLQDTVDAGQFLVERQRCVVPGGQRLRRFAPHHRLEDRFVGTRAMRCIGHRLQHLDALLGRRRFADHVEAMRDQRVFEFEHGFRQLADRLRRIGPGRLRLRQFQRAGLGLDQRREAGRVRRRRPAAGRASARSRPSVRRAPCKVRHGRPAASDS